MPAGADADAEPQFDGQDAVLTALAALEGTVRRIDATVTVLADQAPAHHISRRRPAPSFRQQPQRNTDPARIERLVC